MGLANDVMYRRESEAVHHKESELESHSAPATLGERVLRFFGKNPTEKEIQLAGSVVHWSFGISNGIVYAMLQPRLPIVRAGFGLPFGLALYAFHLAAPPAFRLSPPSWKFPLQTALRGFVYHVVYATTLDVSYRGITHLFDGTE